MDGTSQHHSLFPLSLSLPPSPIISPVVISIAILLTYLLLLSFIRPAPSPQIPAERIHEVEIPTGLPLIFNVRLKCIQLLEDGDEEDSSIESLDPLSRYA